MLPFATEFPVTPLENRAAFVAEVIAWLRGSDYSTVFAASSETELNGENAHLVSKTGEELRLRELDRADRWEATGFRHDYPDGKGRIWRTEGVLRRQVGYLGQDLIRLRTQCLAQKPGVRLDMPQKPYLVKSLLKNGWAGSDGKFVVSDSPVWLDDSENSITTARAVTVGDASRWLPIVYISATGNNTWLLTNTEITKLAYDLGGVAHVVVEPDRAFSFRLREKTDGRNAYGGTVGLSVPERGFLRRYYLGWQIQDSEQLTDAVKVASINLRGQMPAHGWDWTELQEQALRAQRERDRNKLTSQEIERLFEQEIANLQDRIQQLEGQIINQSVAEVVGSDEGEFLIDNLVQLIGPEIYSGEISDRLRFAAKTTLSFTEQISLDRRSKIVFQRLLEKLPESPALNELLEDLGRATKDPKRVAAEITALMKRHGYQEKSDNKHIRLEAKQGVDGLDTITVPKTPSDSRGLKNLRAQIERTLGINRLSN